MPNYFVFDRKIDRRNHRKKDVIIQIISILSVITAAILLTALILLDNAKPDTFSGLNRQLPLKSCWTSSYSSCLFYLMLFGLATSSTGLLLNLKRLKRKYDHLRLNLVFLWILSASGIIIYLIQA